MIKGMTPLLLMEPCGQQVEYPSLTLTDKEQIFGLLERLHVASFTQGSFYWRNIVVQPGPLTLPLEERSLDEPSFRIIDFGRGLCPSVNCTIESFAAEAKWERRNAITCLGLDSEGSSIASAAVATGVGNDSCVTSFWGGIEVTCSHSLDSTPRTVIFPREIQIFCLVSDRKCAQLTDTVDGF